MQKESSLRNRLGLKPANAVSDNIADSAVPQHRPAELQPRSELTISDLIVTLSLVFGGCCSNVWSFEALLRTSSSLGSFITFGQMLFITCQSAPRFLIRDKQSALPRLAPRQVPLGDWTLQVFVLLSSTLLNNWSFAFTPLTLQIVFRSSGLPVSLLLGRIIMKKRYTSLQIVSVVLVTIGVVITTLSRPSSTASPENDDQQYYIIGICMLSLSLFLTGILGLQQERTYKKYGPCWREGVFYTHLLSLPMFIFLREDIQRGFQILRHAHNNLSMAYLVFAVNLITQLLCVSGVNQLASRVSSVSTNLALTARKAISLCLSVWLFGSSWNYGLVTGALLVFLGTISYASVTKRG